MVSDLLERVRERDQLRLAERRAGKGDACWPHLRGETGRVSRVRRRIEESTWDDDARIARLGWRPRAAVPRKEQRVVIVLRARDAVGPVEDLVDGGAGEGDIRRAIALIPERVGARGHCRCIEHLREDREVLPVLRRAGAERDVEVDDVEQRLSRE